MSKYFDDKTMFMEPQVSQYNSHMVMTNVSKETRKKYINIDTKFCDDYANNRLNAGNPSFNLANYNITLPEKINEVKSIVIRNVELPNTFYNISSSAGNHFFQITRTANGNSYMITLDDGQYDQNSLKTAINAKIDAIWDLSSVNYNIINNISQISASQQYTIQFAVSSKGDFDKYNVKSKLGWILGYRNINYTINNGVSANSESIVNLLGNKYMYLAIDEFSKGNQNSFVSSLPGSQINKNIIAKIIINSYIYPFGSILPANNYDGYLMTDKRTYNGKIDLQKLNVQLLDENGFVVNLNGIDFSFCMEVEYE
jgi:hypothetical protein